MNWNRRIVWSIGLLFAIVGVAVAADDAKDNEIKKTRKRYEGTWQVVALEVNGEKSAEVATSKIKVVNYSDGKWVVKIDDKEVEKGTSIIDPTKKPKSIDFVSSKGENQETTLGIYEIDGDSRKLCFAEAGKPRPTEFSSKPGSGHVLVVFRREKK